MSVVIPVYNGERYIQEALDSVFEQTFKSFDVIVVDDGSTDGTRRRVERYGGALLWLSQENGGPSAARMKGVEAARGDFIAFLDADDVWLPGKLQRQLAFAEAHPGYGIVTTDVERFGDSGVILPSLKCWYRPVNGYAMKSLVLNNWIPPSAALVRRECFERGGPFVVPPPNFGEDWVMWVQIAARYRVHFLDEVLVRHRVHAESATSGDSETQFECLLRDLNIMQERVPELRRERGLVREAAFRIHVNRGRTDLAALKLSAARAKLWRALRLKPFSFRTWGLLTAASAPTGFLRGARAAALRYKRRSAPVL